MHISVGVIGIDNNTKRQSRANCSNLAKPALDVAIYNAQLAYNVGGVRYCRLWVQCACLVVDVCGVRGV
jgi:hypothetical protein